MEMTDRIVISYSEIDAFRQCPFKHHLAYRLRYSKPVEDMSALGKGTFWHKIMDTHYATIKAHQTGIGAYTVSATELITKCQEAVTTVLNKAMDNGTDYDLIQLAIWMYRGYLEQHGIDDEWEIIAIEHTAIVPLYDEDGNDTGFDLKVKIDLLVKDSRGRMWIVDHKSCGTLPKDDGDFSFEEQFGLYTVACRRLGFRVFGSLHNAARTKQNQGDIFKPGDPGYKTTMKAQTLAERFKRTRMNRTDAELAMIEQEVLDTATRAYGNNDNPERYPDSDRCRWRCNFTEACLLGRRVNNNGRTIEMLEDSGFTQDFARH